MASTMGLMGQRLLRAVRNAGQRFSVWLLPVGVDFRKINLVEGLRAVFSVAVLVAAAEFSGWSPLLWSPVAAFWTCIVDPGGPMRGRFYVMSTFVMAGSLVTGLGTFLGPYGLLLAVPFAFAVSLLGAMLRIYGSSWGLFGNFFGIAGTIALSKSSGGPPQELLHMAMFALGGCWSMALSLVFWRQHPFKPAREAIGEVYKALAELAIDLRQLIQNDIHDATAWSRHVRQRRAAVRQAIEAARQAALDAARLKGPVSARPSQQVLFLEASDHLFNALIALSDVLELHAEAGDAGTVFQRGDWLLRRITPVLLRFADDVITQTPAAHDRLVHSIDIAVHGINEPDDNEESPDPVSTINRLAALMAARMRTALVVVTVAAPDPDVSATGTPSLVKRILTPLRANLSWQSLASRHALRAATTVTIAEAAALYFDLPYGYWLTITTLATMQPDFAATWSRALQRIGGSVVGAAIVALIGYFFHTPIALTIVIFPLAMATLALRTVNFGVFVMCLTPLFVLIMDLSQHDAATLYLAGERALNSVIGGAIAVLGSLYLWPSWEPAKLPKHIATALDAHAALARKVFGAVLGETPAADIDPARRQAGLTSTNLEAALRRALIEPHLDRRRMDTALVVVAALRRVAGALAAVPFEAEFKTPAGQERLRSVAEWVDKALDSLGKSAAKGESDGPSFAARPDCLSGARIDSRSASPGLRTLSRLVGQIDLMAEAVAPAAGEKRGDELHALRLA